MIPIIVGIVAGVTACACPFLAQWIAQRDASAKIRTRSEEMYRAYVDAEVQRDRIQRLADRAAIDGIVGVSTWEQPHIHEDHCE